MYLFYGDESGHTGMVTTAQQPLLVVAGLLVNTYRAGKTRREFADLLSTLSGFAGQPLQELKGQQLFRGSGPWANCGHVARAAARHEILRWIRNRKHAVVASALLYARLPHAATACPDLAGLSPRAIATLHCALAIQRNQHSPQAAQQNKNVALLVFDRQDSTDQAAVQDLLGQPTPWMSAFVRPKSAPGELSAIVDTAYYADSHRAPLLQVADFLAFMIQRKAALDSGSPTAFAGETAVIDDVWGDLTSLLITKDQRLPSKGGAFATAMRSMSPACLLA